MAPGRSTIVPSQLATLRNQMGRFGWSRLSSRTAARISQVVGKKRENERGLGYSRLGEGDLEKGRARCHWPYKRILIPDCARPTPPPQNSEEGRGTPGTSSPKTPVLTFCLPFRTSS